MIEALMWMNVWREVWGKGRGSKGFEGLQTGSLP